MKRPIRFLWAAASAALALCMLLGCAAGELSADTAPAATAAPAPTATEAPAAEEEALPGLEQIMDPAERVWRYTDDPVRLAAIRDDGWLAADFDDSGWLAAAGSFGANEGRLKEVAGEEPSTSPLCACATICPTGGPCPCTISACASPPDRRR